MSTSAAYQLRRRDGEFARLWDDVLAEGYVRLEAELLVRALGETRDPDNAIDLNEIAADAPSPPAGFDAALAMQLLAQKRAAEMRSGRWARQFRPGSAEDTNAALEKRLTAMEKRLAKRS